MSVSDMLVYDGTEIVDWQPPQDIDHAPTRSLLDLCSTASSLDAFTTLYEKTRNSDSSLLPPLSYLLLLASRPTHPNPSLLTYLLSRLPIPSSTWFDFYHLADSLSRLDSLEIMHRVHYIALALIHLATHGPPSLLTPYLAIGLDPNIAVQSQHDRIGSLLDGAVRAGNEEMVSFILDHGGDPNLHLLNGGVARTPVSAAATSRMPGVAQILRILLRRRGSSREGVALWWAAGAGMVESAKILKEERAKGERIDDSAWLTRRERGEEGSKEWWDVNEVFKAMTAKFEDGRREREILGTALHNAAAWGRLDFARWLLEEGADVLIKDEEGNLAVDLARKNGKLEVVELLEG